jgi:hypothetical protein
MIDYARMQKSGPKLKARLTRATKIVDPAKRYVAVKAACVAVASIDMYLDGSIINHKGGGTIQVAETPEAIYEMIKEKQ